MINSYIFPSHFFAELCQTVAKKIIETIFFNARLTRKSAKKFKDFMLSYYIKRFFLALIFVLSSSTSLKANCNCFGEIEYLFWNVSQVNMPYAIAIEDLNTFANFEEIQQKSHWTSGFRLALGTKICCNFDTKLSWTRFHSQFKDSESGKILIATELLAPNTGTIIGGDGVGGPATSKWCLDFNTIDWDFGMPLCFNQTCSNQEFRLFPYIGLKGCIIRQKQLITYDDFIDTNGGDAVMNAFVTERNNFYGVGPKLGLLCSYSLSLCWKLEGMLAGSLIYGKQNSPSTASFSEPTFSFSSKFLTDKWRSIPFVQCYLGISWHNFMCGCVPYVLGVGYEAQYFFDLWRTQNSIIQQVFITDVSYGALMLQGLTVKLQVFF